MSGKITKWAYQKLIDENIAWLLASTQDSLERQHTIEVLKHAVDMHYPQALASREGEAGTIARELADEAVQHLADSLPTERSIDGMDALTKAGLDGMFALDDKEIRDTVELIIANAIFDGKLYTHPQAAVPEGVRAILFAGWKGCSNHDCIVTGPKKGMGTNGMCKCLIDASRSQLQMLQGRLSALLTTHKERTE
ncbi:MAG: hypothetical protein Q8L60_05660 [Gammaproteobacteria bacterium]|nr:hypothetical protein [Gammaproteobacteria bacterium]MDP2346856.1 hypothetical protein [Gammaproteobacteria bacterium]